MHIPIGTTELYKKTFHWYWFDTMIEEDFDHLTGDVDGDNEINIADICALINQILAAHYTEYADVNRDGEIDIADITALIDILLNGD